MGILGKIKDTAKGKFLLYKAGKKEEKELFEKESAQQFKIERKRKIKQSVRESLEIRRNIAARFDIKKIALKRLRKGKKSSKPSRDVFLGSDNSKGIRII